MAITTVLFDLDGTLLPLNQDEFAKQYFVHLSAFLSTRGYESTQITKALFSSVTAMMGNGFLGGFLPLLRREGTERSAPV